MNLHADVERERLVLVNRGVILQSSAFFPVHFNRGKLALRRKAKDGRKNAGSAQPYTSQGCDYYAMKIPCGMTLVKNN